MPSEIQAKLPQGFNSLMQTNKMGIFQSFPTSFQYKIPFFRLPSLHHSLKSLKGLQLWIPTWCILHRTRTCRFCPPSFYLEIMWQSYLLTASTERRNNLSNLQAALMHTWRYVYCCKTGLTINCESPFNPLRSLWCNKKVTGLISMTISPPLSVLEQITNSFFSPMNCCFTERENSDKSSCQVEKLPRCIRHNKYNTSGVLFSKTFAFCWLNLPALLTDSNFSWHDVKGRCYPWCLKKERNMRKTFFKVLNNEYDTSLSSS